MLSPGVCENILSARTKRSGYGSFKNPDRFLNQDYDLLKQYFLGQRTRFFDEMFPPDKTSIGQGLLSPSDLNRVEWLRPMKIVSNPSFVVDGVSRFDFGQGLVGNCWILASIGALTFQKYIYEQVIPLEQNFDENYIGIFHFRFWRFGRWVDVVIDDKLPTINGRLIFVHSKHPNEFWPALLEKAYAKVCGSYNDMNAGTPAEAMMDFTGGVHMCIKLSDPTPTLWELMIRAGKSRSLMGCGTPQGETSQNTVLLNGLVQGHAYTVTGVKEVVSNGKIVNIVRLLNPWGQTEWNGDWSDTSPLWETVSPQDREMCLSVVDNGEFWMSLEYFCKFYDDLDICGLCADFLDGNSSCHWEKSFHEGRWVAGSTAGGCMNNIESFWTNPQYRITIGKLHNECSGTQGENNVLVSLMQMPDKRNRRLVKNLYIGLSIFELTEEHKSQEGKFPTSFFKRNRTVVQSKSHINARDVMEFLMLRPGEYLIVPSTFNPDETASFILTIHSKVETHVHENSGGHMETTKPVPAQNGVDDENKRKVFFEFSGKSEEMDAEQLQRILNDQILKGDLKSGGFSIDACRSMVALMDTTITGKLDGKEFVRLWKKIISYKDMFFLSDVSHTGTLSASEFRHAITATGKRVSDEILSLMALRYGASSGYITLENFISLLLRFDCMYKIFSRLSDGSSMNIGKSEWMYLSMYT